MRWVRVHSCECLSVTEKAQGPRVTCDSDRGARFPMTDYCGMKGCFMLEKVGSESERQEVDLLVMGSGRRHLFYI